MATKWKNLEIHLNNFLQKLLGRMSPYVICGSLASMSVKFVQTVAFHEELWLPCEPNGKT